MTTELKNDSSWYLRSLRLDGADGAITECFHGSPEDAYGRGIALTVTNGGEPMSLADCTVYLAWSDPTGTGGVREFAPVRPTEGYFEVDFPPGMAEHAPCDVRACVVIHMPQGRVTSSREFAIHVRRPIITDDMAEADENFSAFVQGLIDLRAFDAEIRQAEAARAAAENSRASAESERNSAESARADAETARADAEEARAEAEQKRADAFADWIASGGMQLGFVDDETAVAAVEALF